MWNTSSKVKFSYLQYCDDPANFQVCVGGKSLQLRAEPEAWLVRTGSPHHNALPVDPGLTVPTAGSAEVSMPITREPDVRVVI